MLGTSGSLPRAGPARFAAAGTTRGAPSHVAEPIEHDDITRLGRVRSALLLGTLVAAIGALVAASAGVLVVLLTSLVDQALG